MAAGAATAPRTLKPAMWNLQPTLDGDIVRLEPLAREHHAGLRAVASPAEIWELLVFQRR